jgi:hypothetical protein
MGDISALLVEEDLRCPSMHYFREQAPELRTTDGLDIFLT